MYKISLIAAVSQNNITGINNKMPWHIAEDLSYFKKTTSGHCIIMGRKTFESIGSKPLPGRKNIILSRDKSFIAKNCIIAGSVEESTKYFDKNSENFVIGGATLFRQYIQLAQKLYITKVLKVFEGDSFFPEINLNEWELTTESAIFHDKHSNLNYLFTNYNRINRQ